MSITLTPRNATLGGRLLYARDGSSDTPTVVSTGTTTSSSKVITMSSTRGWVVGMTVTGTGVGDAAVVVSIQRNVSITVSVASTASASVQVTGTGTFTIGAKYFPLPPTSQESGDGSAFFLDMGGLGNVGITTEVAMATIVGNQNGIWGEQGELITGQRMSLAAVVQCIQETVVESAFAAPGAVTLGNGFTPLSMQVPITGWAALYLLDGQTSQLFSAILRARLKFNKISASQGEYTHALDGKIYMNPLNCIVPEAWTAYEAN